MNHKGRRSRWYRRHQPPTRPGAYECLAKITSSAPAFLFDLEWDGKGFIVPIPMVVQWWRGLKHRPRGEKNG